MVKRYHIKKRACSWCGKAIYNVEARYHANCLKLKVKLQNYEDKQNQSVVE